jgi:ketosteroid isomerase-like protein
MTASAAEVVQRFYDAVGRRDLEGALACFSEDAVWILPGRSPIAGEHRGREAIGRNVLSQVGPRSSETFRADLLDVAIGEHHVVAVQHATAERNGKRLDITACQLLTIRDGQIVEVRGHYSDQYALDDFWD